MDIAGTKKKLQRMSKVAEQSYKKMNELLERVQGMQNDLETTSEQVDHIEHELTEQRVLLNALAEQQDIDVEELLEEADLPPHPAEEDEETDENLRKKATSRPSANEK